MTTEPTPSSGDSASSSTAGRARNGGMESTSPDQSKKAPKWQYKCSVCKKVQNAAPFHSVKDSGLPLCQDCVKEAPKSDVDEFVAICEGHYWDSLEKEKHMIMLHLRAMAKKWFPPKHL